MRVVTAVVATVCAAWLGAGAAQAADWQPAKSVSVSANGWAYIRLNVQNAADQAVLPLGDVARVVATTGVGSAIQIDDLLVVQGI